LVAVKCSPPLSPSQTQQLIKSLISLFERRRVLERGRSPLSLKLPFPAINFSESLTLPPAGKGIKGIGMEKPNANSTVIYLRNE
jgi:hypothetical protein